MKTGLVTTPRPVPGKLLPAAGAGLVLLLALALFAITGWDVRGWALGAVLWLALEGISLLLARARRPVRGTASPGLRGFELMLKSLAALVVLVATAASDPHLALAATLVFALAYTFELALSLVSYFGGGS